jgi:hypothetical protein
MPEGLNNQETQQEENVIQQPSPIEQEARASGWVPKEEFDGDEHKWVDAGEFVRRGELFKKIDIQNKELKEVKKSLQLLAQHNQKIKEVEYQRALAALKAQKKEALLEGDADQLIAIDEKIDLVKEHQKTLHREAVQEVQQEVEEIHPEMQAWVNRNNWYETNKPMKAFADALGTELARSGMRPADVLKEVEKQVRAEFPNKFKNPNRDKPGSVEGASSKGASSSGGYSPTEVERQVARKFVKQGVFKSEAEYYKQLEGISK